MKRTLIATIIITLISATLFSDTITMKNGDSLKGKIIYQTDKIVEIKTKFGKIRVPKIKIKSIKISKTAKPKERVYIKLKSDKIISGTIIQQNSKTMVLIHNNIKITISKTNIAQLSWEPIIVKKNNRWDSIWRSALLPSWGQFYDEKKTKGIVIASIMGILSIATITSQIDYNSKLNNYLNADVKTESLFNTAEDARKRTNNLIVGLTIGWVLNIADAILFSSNGTKKMLANSGLRSPQFEKGGYGLEFFKRF